MPFVCFLSNFLSYCEILFYFFLLLDASKKAPKKTPKKTPTDNTTDGTNSKTTADSSDDVALIGAVVGVVVIVLIITIVVVVIKCCSERRNTRRGRQARTNIMSEQPAEMPLTTNTYPYSEGSSCQPTDPSHGTEYLDEKPTPAIVRGHQTQPSAPLSDGAQEDNSSTFTPLLPTSQTTNPPPYPTVSTEGEAPYPNVPPPSYNEVVTSS